MQRDRVAVIAAAVFAVLIVAAALLLVFASRAAERIIPIAGLRSGVDFELAEVRFQLVSFEDFQNGPMVDGGYHATFRVLFADGATEELSFSFDGYCPAGAVSEASSVHRSPRAFLRHTCGEDFIRAVVA